MSRWSKRKIHTLILVWLVLAAPGRSLAASAINYAPYLRGINNGSRCFKVVALTFDACRISEKTILDRSILKVLMEYRVPATIFLTGRWMEAHPEETTELAQNPLIELGTHSYTHPDMRWLDETALRREIISANDLLQKLTGHRSNLFRFPYGHFDQRTINAVYALGLLPIGWDVVSGDPDPSIKPKAMASHVIRNTRPGSIIIMHINGRGRNTSAALPLIISELRARGFSFVTISELLSRGYNDETRE